MNNPLDTFQQKSLARLRSLAPFPALPRFVGELDRLAQTHSEEQIGRWAYNFWLNGPIESFSPRQFAVLNSMADVYYFTRGEGRA